MKITLLTSGLVLALALALTVVQAQIVIDQLFSTLWNYTSVVQFSNPQIAFQPGTPPKASINSTKTTPDVIGITIKDKQLQQTVDLIGAGITDSASIVLQAFKAAHPDDYWELMHMLFSQDPAWIQRGGAGLSAVRSPLGACDFGLAPYTYDDTYDGSTDEDLSLFTLDRAPKLFETIQDIQKVNPDIKTFWAPWSAPGWMKDNPQNQQPLYGGTLKAGFEDVFARYLAKAMSSIASEKGIQPYALSVQNEPTLSLQNYPSMKLSTTQAAAIGDKVKQYLRAQGQGSIKTLVYDMNWDNPQYAIDAQDQSERDTWDGVAWHGYAGKPSAQDQFSKAYPDKEVYFTEYTHITQFGNEPWPNIKSNAANLLVGTVRYGSRSVILWNAALQVDEDGFTTPRLPNVCTNCAAPVLLSADATNGDATASLADTTGTKMRTVEMAQGSTTSTRRRRGLRVERRQEATPASTPSGASANQFYRLTSDYVSLSHLSLAVRPRARGGGYGRRVGSTNTDELTELGGRVLAQSFRTELPDQAGQSRWSLLLLNQNDHYVTGVYEDVTVSIGFRGQVANFTSGPGLYT